MKNLFLTLISLVVIGSTGYFLYFYFLPVCSQPLKYSIGQFDSEFGVSKENFKSYILEAEKVWEKALAKDIFIYDEQANFKINLIYDERQQTTIQKQRVESGLTASEDILKKLDLEFENLKRVYEARVALHELAVSNFEEKQKSYEARVGYWNKKGGASKEEYESLKKELEFLNAELDRLNAETASINLLNKDLNNLLERRNLAAAEYNKVALNYNKKYGHGLEFDQAEYVSGNSYKDRGEVNVYQFGGKYDLTLALTHEFGHALGMGHVENPKSVMYYVTSENTKGAPLLSSEDLLELERVCNTK